MSLFNLSNEPIGVDIGHRHVKLAQVRRGRLWAWACLNRVSAGEWPETPEIRRIAETIRCGRFSGRQVVLAVPPERLLTGILELPPRSSGAPVDQLAKSELARRHETTVQEIESCSWDLPSPARAANRTYMMAVACAHRETEALIAACEGAGLQVQSIETQATAAARACGAMFDDLGGTGAVLDIGWNSAQLVLMYQGIVVYHRNLVKCGLEALAGGISRQPGTTGEMIEQWLSCDEPQAALPPAALAAGLETVASELRIPLSYLANQYPDAHVRRLLLVGGGARTAGMKAHLGKALALETRTVRASDLCQCDADAETSGGGPSLAVAIGLSQYTEEVNS